MFRIDVELFTFGIEEDFVDAIGSVAIFFEESFLLLLILLINVFVGDKKVRNCNSSNSSLWGKIPHGINSMSRLNQLGG